MSNRAGFTLIETAFVAAAVGIGVSLMAVAVGNSAQPEDEKPAKAEKVSGDPEAIKAAKAAKAAEKQLKDSVQVRGIHQGLVLWAQNNQDTMPLPSVLDVKNTTVKDLGADKDTTAAILSLLVYNGFVSPELLVSPAESNPKITVCDNYEYSGPKGAIMPAVALWDPGFSVDFSDGNIGHDSYAHAMPSKSRLGNWKNKFEADRPVIGNRGPKVTGVKAVEDGVEPELPGRSNTYAIHGAPDAWEGNIAFGDNHVDFTTKMIRAKHTYTDADGKQHPDVFFYNEPDDASDTNTVMGIFTRAGATTKSFKAIWD